MLAHWDDVPTSDANVGHLVARWRDLGRAAGTRDVGVKRIEVAPGRWSTPLHRETAEEEIFYVLGGSGISLQDDRAHEVRAGDCIVHRAGREAHTLRAGPDGLDVLAFGTRVATQLSPLPRAGVYWVGGTWGDLGGGARPWEREAAAGEPDVPGPSPRPETIVNVADVEEDEGWREVGWAAGSERTGLNHVDVPPRKLHCPPHCHSAEEQVFIVLEGSGTLELLPSPALREAGREPETHEVRPGHVVSRPAGTAMAHAFRGGDEGLTLLAYGTRDGRDVAYYPRSNKIFFRGVGVMARLEHLPYALDEPDE